MKKIAIILAGGKGTRLWPLSRENYPKQFVKFQGRLSLFQSAVKRTLACFSPENTYIISQENYRFTAQNQIDLLPGLNKKAADSLKKNIIFEPVPKSTLPAVLLAVKYAEGRNGLEDDDLIYVFPSDQIIEPVKAFVKYVKKADALAVKDKIVIFGVRAAYPKEGYGYIVTKRRYETGFLAYKFVEKPSKEKAKALMDEGAFWNAGIFGFNKKTFFEELRRFQPEIYRYNGYAYSRLLKNFGKIKAISIDYGIMQSTKKAALVEFGLTWSDLGSWDSFLQFFGGGKINFHIGKAEFLDSRGCFTYSNSRLMCMIGLNDIMAIDSPDALLLVRKGYSDRVKELVSVIDRKKHVHSKDGATVHRPWGYYTVLHEGRGYKVKEIGIYPKKSLSLQRHKHRSEHWNVVEGEVRVSVAGEDKFARRNESIYVPKGVKHRIYNPANKITKIIETQIGPYVGEDDIVRFTKY